MGEVKENLAVYGDDSDSAFVAVLTFNLVLSFVCIDVSL